MSLFYRETAGETVCFRRRVEFSLCVSVSTTLRESGQRIPRSELWSQDRGQNFGLSLASRFYHLCSFDEFCGKLSWTWHYGSYQLTTVLSHGELSSICICMSIAQSPRKLDVFTGVIYWTPWSRDKLLRRENLGRGNTTAVLMGQTSIEALRFVHELRYGTGTISMLSLFLSTTVFQIFDWSARRSWHLRLYRDA